MSGQQTVTDLNVTLNSFSHQPTYDVDLLLEGPTGVRVMLMSDAIYDGQTTNACRSAPGSFNLTFDDAAPTRLNLPWRSGTYRPSDADDSRCDESDWLVPPPTATTLSAFNGTNPNGRWILHSADDSFDSSFSDTIAGGWTLDFTTTPQPSASGDLQIQGPADSAYHNFRTCRVAAAGGTLKYPIKFENTGDEPAQYRLKIRPPFKLYSSPTSTKELEQGTFGYLTSEIGAGTRKTYTIKMKIPTDDYQYVDNADLELRDMTGSRLDRVGVCAAVAAPTKAEWPQDWLVKAGAQKQVSGDYVHAQGATVTGKTLAVGGAAATFTAKLKNYGATPWRATIRLNDQRWPGSPLCSNISIVVKDGRVDITDQVIDRDYLTRPIPKGGTRKLAITVKATAPGSGDESGGCNSDYWAVVGGEIGEVPSIAFMEVNLAA